MNSYIAYFDGACEPVNPGGTATNPKLFAPGLKRLAIVVCVNACCLAFLQTDLDSRRAFAGSGGSFAGLPGILRPLRARRNLTRLRLLLLRISGHSHGRDKKQHRANTNVLVMELHDPVLPPEGKPERDTRDWPNVYVT